MDIKIVGAGPAGLITALRLRKLDGANITVFEKQPRDNYKSTPCGEGMSTKRLKELRRETGFDSFPHVDKRLEGAKAIFSGGNELLIKKDSVTLNRTQWQESMISFLEERGIDIIFDEEIRKPEELQYDYLIGAEGPSSFTRKYIGGERKVKPAVQYRMNIEREPDFLEFYFDEPFKEEYGWIFPKDGGRANIGCEGDFELLDKFLQRRGLEGDILTKEAYPVSVGGTRFQKEDIFLVGGAAGLTNYLTGGGLAPIMQSSKLLERSLKDNRKYSEAVRESGLNPERWREHWDFFYSSNRKVKKLAKILDGEDFISPSFFGILKVLFRPTLWSSVIKFRNIIKNIIHFAW